MVKRTRGSCRKRSVIWMDLGCSQKHCLAAREGGLLIRRGDVPPATSTAKVDGSESRPERGRLRSAGRRVGRGKPNVGKNSPTNGAGGLCGLNSHRSGEISPIYLPSCSGFRLDSHTPARTTSVLADRRYQTGSVVEEPQERSQLTGRSTVQRHCAL